ncbi:mannose-6-phosphate isomerase [Bordetella ansorpii]|jgi:mannose/cellobiose epimerase-like protein (N-acyl-D-glucosamine 2-epimerase family)|uniref:Mannose-6-phosphate isomerase n=1 Tax=Bordetella ansorpii TaxID=288768 RepID=A0A157RB82_9BORD|nr:AGE family epimerase/isomerase [Bordetella ansorpii]SAI55248.1 mannose-6-phosphate isomerase [Bordetella ansorpii]
MLHALADTVRALRRHLDDVILPQWRQAGFNAALGLPHEAISQDGVPLPDQRYRAMACARQIYVHARAPGDEAAAHAAVLFDGLLRHFHDAATGNWHFSVDADARPLDRTQDLYTYAFVIFASAVVFERTRDPRARRTMLATTQAVEARFRRSDGGYDAALDATGVALRGPEQNPVMHLTEAYQAAARVAEPAWFAQKLRDIADDVAGRHLDARTQCIAELPLGTAGNRVEPGHQFEWVALLHCAPQVYEGLSLTLAVPRGSLWARGQGVDAATAGVCAALDPAGPVSDAMQRIWAQTEYARYLALTGDYPALAHQLEQFRTRFLHETGWREVLHPNGELARADMPATTPYHLATCYEALENVVENLAK